MRKKVLAALLAAAVAGTTVFAGTAVFAAGNKKEAKAGAGKKKIQAAPPAQQNKNIEIKQA